MIKNIGENKYKKIDVKFNEIKNITKSEYLVIIIILMLILIILYYLVYILLFKIY